MKRTYLGIALLMLAAPLKSWALSLGEGIVLDPNTGDYIITYTNAVGQLKQSRFVPSTKIEPSLYSRFENERGLIHYRYVLKNGTASKQPLIGLILDPLSSLQGNVALPQTGQEMLQALQQQQNNAAKLEQTLNQINGAVDAPAGWSCEVLPKGEAVQSGFRVPCSFNDLDEKKHNGLQPGKSISGFSFYSMDLPGVEMAQLGGFGDMGPGFTDEGPDGEIADQLDQMVKKDFVPRPAAIPTIAVPNPFDAAALLGSIQTQMHTWISMQLLDATFSSQLDRYFQSAISACRLNQAGACKQQIETMRAMVKKEQPNTGNGEGESANNSGDSRHKAARTALIDPLAASVLDFDLQYVMTRMDSGDGEQASTGGSDSAYHSEHRRKK